MPDLGQFRPEPTVPPKRAETVIEITETTADRRRIDHRSPCKETAAFSLVHRRRQLSDTPRTVSCKEQTHNSIIACSTIDYIAGMSQDC
jgi:hypothetical protein